MKLPLRMSSAQALLDEYEPYVQLSNINPEAQAKFEVISRLNSLVNMCTVASESMLHTLGFQGSLEEMEATLQKRISDLQATTFNLNGTHLRDFILDEFSSAAAYTDQFQEFFEYYKNFIRQFISTRITNSKDIEREVLIDINRDFGQTIAEGTIQVDLVRGQTKVGRKGASRGAILKLDKTLNKSSSVIYKTILQLFQNPSSFDIPEVMKQAYLSWKAEKGENFLTIHLGTSNNKQNILSYMKSKNSVLKTIPGYETALLYTNRYMIDYICLNCPGADRYILEKCIQDILKDKPEAFIVGAQSTNLTGILGEIQGLYYIRYILQENKVDNLLSAEWVGGLKNPHADVILKSATDIFGIQVKNTSIDNAKHRIAFENFKSTVAKGLSTDSFLSLEWAKTQMGHQYNATFIDPEDKQLYDAAVSILGMYEFNIPFVSRHEGNRNVYYEADISDVPDFAPTRERIERDAKIAKILLAQFIAGMMYMQLSTEINESNINNANANTLYLIGGKLAITSATILKDMVKKFKDDLQSFNLSFHVGKEVNTVKGTKTIVPFTIIDVFNNPTKDTRTAGARAILESSYTFKMP